MSAKLMGQVWDLELDHNHQLILLALADHAADDGGSIYPGVDYLVWKTGYSKRQIQRIMSELEEMKLITSLGSHVGGRGNKIEWQLDLSKGVKKPPFTRKKGCQNGIVKKGDILSKGAISDTERVPSGALKGDISESSHISTRARGTIIEPSIEPSVHARTESGEVFEDPISKFPEIANAVFNVLGYKFKTRYRMGAVSPKKKQEFQNLIGMLAYENRTLEEIGLFKTNWPGYVNNPHATEPQPWQMMDKFDQVVGWKPKQKTQEVQHYAGSNGTDTKSHNERQLNKFIERRGARVSAAGK